MKDHKKLTVFYDGLCKLCSAEINHYKKQNGADQIHFIDICSTTFDATKEGVDPKAVHKVMHVRKSDGTLATKVDAFIEIWSILPKYQFLAKLARTPLVHLGLNLGYSSFAAIRPWLPRYKNLDQCKDSPYCEMKGSL